MDSSYALAGKKQLNLWMSLLFLLYPGFLSQPNAIDYLCHQAGLAAGLLSIGLTIRAVQAKTLTRRIFLYFISILFGWFYLGQIEWYIGLEFLRFACILLILTRQNVSLLLKAGRFFLYSLPALSAPGVFLVWRLFFFESERGATDVDLQLGDLRARPFTFLIKYFSVLVNDFLDVLIHAWWLPLRRLSAGMNPQDWIPGLGIALLALLLLWMASRVIQQPEDAEAGQRYGWRRDVLWIGLGAIVFGLFPVILVSRSVDFKNFSRYTLIASVGAAMLWPLALSYISSLRLRNVLFEILIISASLTHYANGLAKSRETEALRSFWWQVSWRIPQLEKGATLVTHYSVAAEEDYFTWGPANLIYYPESDNEKYVQPAVFSVLLDQETIDKAVAREPQKYSSRRSIVSYPNHRNLLIITQPTPGSCAQVIDHNQVELSSSEDERVAALAPYSESEQVLLGQFFRTPPAIPFDSEPPKEWCYFYEKASYARQVGDWDEVLRLGEESISQGYFARDQIEWMPVLQAYASSDNIVRLNLIASFMTSDLQARQQACHTLAAISFAPDTLNEINRLFCVE